MIPRSSVPRSTRRLHLMLLGAVAALLLAACGSETAPGGPPGSPAGAFPVTVEHAYGSTTITEAPRRVVTLGYTDPDPLLALGIAPVGIVDWYQQPPANNRWVWQEAGFAGAVPEIVGVRDEYNVERIAALAPDLIVASYSGMTREQYDQLSRITEVVAQPPGFEQFTAPWQVMTQQIARAVGQEARGRELVAQTERKVADVRAANPQWAGRTAAVAAYQGGTYSLFAPGDAKADLLIQLGFVLPPEIGRLAAGASDTDISPERVDLLEVDKLLWLAPTPARQAEIESRPEYATLAVSRQNRDLFLISADRQEPIAGAFGYNSVLSLPYVLDRLPPKLNALPPRS